MLRQRIRIGTTARKRAQLKIVKETHNATTEDGSEQEQQLTKKA